MGVLEKIGVTGKPECVVTKTKAEILLEWLLTGIQCTKEVWLEDKVSPIKTGNIWDTDNIGKIRNRAGMFAKSESQDNKLNLDVRF